MPTFRDLFPKFGRIGKKQIKKTLQNIYLRDALFVLSKLSRHYFKYCQMDYEKQEDAYQVYRIRCFELLDTVTINEINNCELHNKKTYTIIFPELSILHLIKMSLKYCDNSNYTKTKNFSPTILQSIGKCLLITNSIMNDWQLRNVPDRSSASEELLVNFTKQMIVDKNFNVFQKFYQCYFLFDYLKNYSRYFDIEDIFIKKYQVNVDEYFAFLFAVYSQFLVKNTTEEDSENPHLNLVNALIKLKPKFKGKLLENLFINNIKYKKIDESFFNVTTITKYPLIKFDDGIIIIPLSLRRLLLSLTDSVYFDIVDYISDSKQKNEFSKYFGKSIENYFKNILINIDKNTIFEFEYGREKIKSPDGILIQKNDAIFFECKKKQFHDLQFLQSGNKELFFEKMNKFFYAPLKQICEKIVDFRRSKLVLNGISKDAWIYPVVVCPQAPPIFSGAWDKFNLDERVLPDLYKSDMRIAPPEFIDFAELECIEEYLKNKPDKSFIDLIRLKRGDKEYHNSNWMVILQKNGMALQNKRLVKEYLGKVVDFKHILFDK